MKITFVLSKYPPILCGIGDYTAKLKDQLENLGYKINIIDGLSWKFEPFRLSKLIKQSNPDIIHFQFPSTGIMFFLLSIHCRKYRLYVTCHEFFETSLMRRLFQYIFLFVYKFFIETIIWTTQFEKNKFVSLYPWAKEKSKIIPIGSNIPFLPSKTKQRKLQITFFGLAEPSTKRIKNFLRLVDYTKNLNLSYDYNIICGVTDEHKHYFNILKKKYSASNIHFYINLNPMEIAAKLSETKYVYLPFDNGISERSTSLLASLGNGCVVFSSKGKSTTSDLEKNLILVDSHEEIIEEIEKIEQNGSFLTKSLNSITYALHKDWDTIIRKHIELYESDH